MGYLTTDTPSIYAPLFVIKKSFNFKKSKAKDIHPNIKSYKSNRPVIFRAQDYWFRKNRNLSVMNFKLDDLVENMV